MFYPKYNPDHITLVICGTLWGRDSCYFRFNQPFTNDPDH